MILNAASVTGAALAIAEFVVPRSTAHWPAATRSRSLIGLKTRVRSASAYLCQASSANMLQVTMVISENAITIAEMKWRIFIKKLGRQPELGRLWLTGGEDRKRRRAQFLSMSIRTRIV